MEYAKDLKIIIRFHFLLEPENRDSQFSSQRIQNMKYFFHRIETISSLISISDNSFKMINYLKNIFSI